MESSKIKTIVILMLAVTNLFLLGLVVQEEREARRLEREALENAVAFLNQRGIQIDLEIVPEGMELPPQQAERKLDQEQALAEALLGGGARADALGGQVYRYTGPNGEIQFHNDGTFSAQLNASALPREGEALEAWARGLLDQLDFEGEVLELGEGYAALRQCLDRVPLLNHRVELSWDRDGVRLTGRRLMGEPVPGKSGSGMTVPTALMDIFTGLNRLGDVCSQILQIQQSYVSLSTLHGSMDLRPVWYIATDTGSYQLDTVSGQLSRAAA